MVRRAHPQPGVDLTYIKQSGESDGDAGDKYTGLDRFGRIVDQRWLKTSDGSAVDRFQYGYDRDSNRLYQKNLIDATISELYHANGASNGYDPLNQISEFRRGTLSDANSDGVPDTVTTASRSQVWSYDPLGNWSTVTNDGTAQNRSFNKQNQITSITSLTTPTYDSNGNMTGDENGKTLVYDAWNRLVNYKNGSTSLESYKFDALNRRITENSGTARELYLTANWQVIEERTSGVARVSMVWSPVYIDALIVRDRDADNNGSLEERLYATHDANWDVTSVANTSAAVQERYIYDPFGTPTFKDANYGSRGSSSFAWNVLHQGGRQSSTSGLYDFRNRELSAGLGVWNRVDPAGLRTKEVDLYRALLDNPTDIVDPTGLDGGATLVGGGVATGAATGGAGAAVGIGAVVTIPCFALAVACGAHEPVLETLLKCKDLRKPINPRPRPPSKKECDHIYNAEVQECMDSYQAHPISRATCLERAMNRYADCRAGRWPPKSPLHEGLPLPGD